MTLLTDNILKVAKGLNSIYCSSGNGLYYETSANPNSSSTFPSSALTDISNKAFWQNAYATYNLLLVERNPKLWITLPTLLLK